MLWQKAIRETAWRFLVGLALMVGTLTSIILNYPALLSQAASGELARRSPETARLIEHFGGYVAQQWFQDSAVQLLLLFAVLLGTGGLVSQGGGSALFTLSMPVTRRRLLLVRVVTGFGELALLALIPALLACGLAPLVHQSFPLDQALVYAVCLLVGGSVYFLIPVLLSTIFDDIWRPLLVSLATVLFALILKTQTHGHILSRLMAGGVFAANGQIPWLDMAGCAVPALCLLYAATRHLTRRDF